MTRGAYTRKVKLPKTVQVDNSTPPVPGIPSWASKPLRTPTFLSRNSSETKLAGEQSVPAKNAPLQRHGTADSLTRPPHISVDSTHICTDSRSDQGQMSPSLSNELDGSAPSRTSSADHSGDEDTYEAGLDNFDGLTIEESQSGASSLYSRDSTSIYSKDNASIYSSASSVYSSGASTYSFDEYGTKELDRYPTTDSIAEETGVSYNSRVPPGPQYQQRARPALVRRPEFQDAASREASSLAKKAALFKNSRLPPKLPSFATSLPAWSMICRAAQASNDCYNSEAPTRLGTYTPANTSKDIKAMILDDQLIDDSRLLIVAVRGTEFKSLTDWSVNKAAKPVNPVGFLDIEENAVHAGFLTVTKAMVSQVAAQLRKQLSEEVESSDSPRVRNSAFSEKPSLLITGHSAGGAVASMLYSHMMSTTLQSDLIALTSQFSSINCVTFGAPPLSLTPLTRRDHVDGIFLSFANEGDPVTRMSDAYYVKSLAKLMTALAPSSAVPAKAKVVRRSRGTAIVREIVPAAPATPWEELPLWPTPPAPLSNAGDVILLRDENGSGAASSVTVEDLSDVIFGDLAQHGMDTYIRRIRDVAFAAMVGRKIN